MKHRFRQSALMFSEGAQKGLLTGMGDIREFVLPEGIERPLQEELYSFSFAGCGFLGVYHIGALSCIRKHIPHLLLDAKICGASAGALIACCEICQIPSNKCIDLALKLVAEAHKRNLGALDPDFIISAHLREIMDDILPENAHELCSGRLFVSLSTVGLKGEGLKPEFAIENQIISNFPTREDLIEILMCSCFIPVFSDSDLHLLNEEIAMDGAFTDNLPRINSDTILICPLAGDSHISPLHKYHGNGRNEGCEVGEDLSGNNCHPRMKLISISNTSMNLSMDNLFRFIQGFFPPGAEKLLDYCYEGYVDAYRYLVKSNMIRCRRHQVFTYLPNRHHPIHSDCNECKSLIENGFANATPAEDAYFRQCLQTLNIRGTGSFAEGSYGFWDVAKMLTSLPMDMCRTLRTISKLSACTAVKMTKNIVLGPIQDLMLLMDLWLNPDERKRCRVLLLRHCVLHTMKSLELCLHVLGYAATTRAFEILKWLYFKSLEDSRPNRQHKNKEDVEHVQEDKKIQAEADSDNRLFAVIVWHSEEEHQDWVAAHKQYEEVLSVHYQDDVEHKLVEGFFERSLIC